MQEIANRYQLTEVIGSGGMSEVWAADDTLLGRDVAVKILKMDLARDENFRERFRKEAQNSARLNHPNIVAVYDTGDTVVDGIELPYIVMERVYGRTLRQIVREDGPMAPEEAAQIMGAVCAALQSSHEAGIIHRDIKPANIMVNNTGQVKVMDFGIARAVDDATSAMTQTAAVIGTAQYLSPEQARGKAADARSDVYAVGCVLYEAVTGVPPFEGESPFAVAYQHVQEDAVAPSERIEDPNLTPTDAVNIDAVVLTAMAKHPADRYETIAELGEDLDLLAKGAVTKAARAHVSVGPDAEAATVAVAPAGATALTQAEELDDADVDKADADTSDAEKEEAQRPARWPRVLSAILAIALVAGLVALAVHVVRSNNRADEEPVTVVPNAQMVMVPDVLGWRAADAEAELERLGLVVEIREEPSPDIRRGDVSGLNPAAGSELRPGTTVQMIVSSGRELTDVPNLVGMTPQQASDALAEAGLELNSRVLEEHSDTVDRGQISDQNPSAGMQISKGTEITITVSLGPELVQVPDLSGLRVNQAQSALSASGLRSEVVVEDSLAPEGEVVRMAPTDTDLERGSTVTLYVSNGMLMTMPDITRLTPGNAVTALRQAGWQGSDAELHRGEPVPTGALIDDGHIAWSGPEAGAVVRRDAPIDIRVWTYTPAQNIEDLLTHIPGASPR